MPAAACLFLGRPYYRREEFLSGLARLGYAIAPTPSPRPGADDILLIWNRKGAESAVAARYEAAGARVIVAENGYINGAGGEKRYALALGHHNGAGRWPVGGAERFAAMGLELKPWRTVGEHVLFLPQRGIGEPGVAQPPGWPSRCFSALCARTARPVRVRQHPGSDKTEPYIDLDHAHCAVTWGSGAAIKALAYGIPVFHALGPWIGSGAALPLDGADLERPLLDDAKRLSMFERLAYAQWTMAEIVSGEAFAWLLQ